MAYDIEAKFKKACEIVKSNKNVIFQTQLQGLIGVSPEWFNVNFINNPEKSDTIKSLLEQNKADLFKHATNCIRNLAETKPEAAIAALKLSNKEAKEILTYNKNQTDLTSNGEKIEFIVNIQPYE